jgi:hypothetical protein
VDFWHVGDVLYFVKQVNEEQLVASTESSSSGCGNSEGGDGADTGTSTGGTITSDTLDYIESIKENSSPPTVLTADYTYIPTYTPTDVW